MKSLMVLLFLLFSVSVNHASAKGNQMPLSPNRNFQSFAQSLPLTETEQESLLYMREEEKLARDVYLTLYDEFSSDIFFNIAQSEQKHMDSIKTLLDQFSLPDPVVDDSIGQFTNPFFTDFYNNNTAQPNMMLTDALRVGILIEETDIVDLQEALLTVENPAIRNVYENLLRGSRNHLRAFVTRLEALGVVYEATVLDQATADAIVNSPMERGGPKQSGRKQGKGRFSAR